MHHLLLAGSPWYLATPGGLGGWTGGGMLLAPPPPPYLSGVSALHHWIAAEQRRLALLEEAWRQHSLEHLYPCCEQRAQGSITIPLSSHSPSGPPLSHGTATQRVPRESGDMKYREARRPSLGEEKREVSKAPTSQPSVQVVPTPAEEREILRWARDAYHHDGRAPDRRRQDQTDPEPPLRMATENQEIFPPDFEPQEEEVGEAGVVEAMGGCEASCQAKGCSSSASPFNDDEGEVIELLGQ